MFREFWREGFLVLELLESDGDELLETDGDEKECFAMCGVVLVFCFEESCGTVF